MERRRSRAVGAVDPSLRVLQHRREVQRALGHPEWQRTIRRRRLSLLAGVATVVMVGFWTRPEPRHCDMFVSNEQAQEYLRSHPDQGVWLDVDGDGAACA